MPSKIKYKIKSIIINNINNIKENNIICSIVNNIVYTTINNTNSNVIGVNDNKESM